VGLVIIVYPDSLFTLNYTQTEYLTRPITMSAIYLNRVNLNQKATMSGPICAKAVKTVHINMTSLHLNIIACPMTFVDVLDLRC
jgi:hypothetical protein